MNRTLAAVTLATAVLFTAACSGTDRPGPPGPTDTAAGGSVGAVAPSPEPTPVTGTHTLAHGTQQGFANCVIDYRRAQSGAAASTFTAYILDDSGHAWSPADSDPYSVMFEMTVSDASGGRHSVSENFGSGSRTAADNGGSDWYTTTQGDLKVSADNTHGVLAATVQERLAQVSGVQGDITITGTDDNSVRTKDCAVRPG